MSLVRNISGKVRKALRKDPRYIIRRLCMEVSMEAERYLGPRRARAFDIGVLGQAAGYATLGSIWQMLASKAYAHPKLTDSEALERLQPGVVSELAARAQHAMHHEIELLGSGLISLPASIDWHADMKTGLRWEPKFHRDIDYVNLDKSSDVKMAWELSRLQWALPLGQAWLLHRDEACALKARDLLGQWISANPYGASVNWACTMEPALRILSWTWLFHACSDAPAWADTAFRRCFLEALYMHGDFVARNLEKADINGNHYTADAAGLVYAGLFFGSLGDAPRWAAKGWEILCAEISHQVFADGVDFEGSIPYHRLVLELFAYPALYRQQLGLEVPAFYRQRLLQMGHFTAAYSRFDGSSPLWGDADDGRALAFGVQPLGDHRYLIGLLAEVFSDDGLRTCFSGPRDEIAWLIGIDPASHLPARSEQISLGSEAFQDGGFYVLRSERSHVFIDCGPLGLAGRGGHGHNDLLAFEAMLDGVLLISDCGAYVYTASARERNRFRSTSSHNTPQVDGEEINRFIHPDYLWALRNDAAHKVMQWRVGAKKSVFEGQHNGYSRLPDPVLIRRRIELDHVTHTLRILDQFICETEHSIRVPYHLAQGVEVQLAADGATLFAKGQKFQARWYTDTPWQARIESGRVSMSYGVFFVTQILSFSTNAKPKYLEVTIEPLHV